MSLNKVIEMGRFTADPELRKTPGGKSVTSFTLAVDRDSKGPNGEKLTDFFDFVAWEKTAETICRYFTKGRMAVVEGSLQTRGWEDKQGNKRKAVEVVVRSIYFADSKPADQQQSAPPAFDPNAYGGGNGFVPMDGSLDDSDLPF